MSTPIKGSSTPQPLPVREGRTLLEPRPLTVKRGVNPHAPGSAHLIMGRTEIMATVSIQDKAAPHMRGSKEGWLTAEYSMLPRATTDRQARERNLQDGRRYEIQRLLGRALRASMDLRHFRNQTLYVDCDVLVADGGTRVASILAGHAALHDFCDRLIQKGQLTDWPIAHNVGAISVGLLRDEVRVDLDYAEDRVARADLNVVATDTGLIIEVQGGAEEGALTQEEYVRLLSTGAFAVQGVMADLTRQLSVIQGM
ncbi:MULTISPECIES: ribonuclease PH [unclassified Deinococcus]|uniref:ribonuclease PH n=1 Tax=unclassified Deinococcus TaxID=2623546 RepID=UPI0006DBF05F|nr:MULTISPECIES: ribonuclease PH [unclassified Deinococcus]MBX8465499.1 ribonuclease PH [Deinococcus sp. RIT780]MCD0157210.1 ribonuclease PH [Deinococcus sp. 6GRE01]MCD0161511.1 ribonuclease PH [Deinococcus sp. 6YEL10]MCD0165427.1 ribonuclease PH [Deinococcus sp. 12RED42]MCD0169423.1 ribonuclease PH [Deinococcus sp. 23YEL01]